MTRPVEKHAAYHELLESLRSAKICALCELRQRSTHRYLDNMLHEFVNDSGLRGRLLASRGFCRSHTDALLQFNNGLASSILYQDQVEAALDFISRLKALNPRMARRKARTDWEKHAPCTLCEDEQRRDAMRIGTLANHLDDSAMQQALAASPGLCVPHLLQALEKLDDPALRRQFIELHEGKFAQLRDELAEFIRKRDYRYAREEQGREADAWRRAPWMILGGSARGG